MAVKLGPSLLILISLFAIIFGIILHSIGIDESKYSSPPAKSFEQNVIIGDESSDLVWFLQVTDLHISYNHKERERDFREFAENYVRIFDPALVLVTGDITDGRMPDTLFGSGPQLDEWLAYSSAINRSIEANDNKTVWLDIRGNHDNFNVYRPRDKNTLYRKHSVQGKYHERNYMHILEKDGKKYSFIGVDEVQTPGLKIPFNFLGIVNGDDMDQLRKFKKISEERNSQYNVWFAHYPTSSIASPDEGIRNVVDGPYLCGHYHTIGNRVNEMHATQQSGFVELELGDWKYNKLVRLAAIDHQLFSFVDFLYKEFPIALMTNPKPPKHLMPRFEPIGRIMNSTHMRVIAFSNVTITEVEIAIDNGDKISMTSSRDHLYVIKWDPKNYAVGQHSVRIYVTDSEGKHASFNQSFSLDGSKEDFPLASRAFIRLQFRVAMMSLFYFTVFVCTVPISFLRLLKSNRSETNLRNQYQGTLIYKLRSLSKVDRLFWPLLIIPIWMSIGPLFVGRMVDEAIGICFVWGVIIDGSFLHTGITFSTSSVFILLIHIPVTILLTYQVKSSNNSIEISGKTASIVNFRLLIHIALTVLQLLMGSLLFSAYGTLAYATSFPFFWCIAIYSYCWYQCTTLKKSDYPELCSSVNREEQQALTDQRVDDKSHTSDRSTC